MNYYPFHVGDYMAHTAHLDPLEDIAYRRLLDLYYLREEPIPADPAEAARLVRMRKNAAEVAAILSEFFVLTDDGWRHGRCDAELSKMQDKQSKARASANASVNARKANAQRTVNERSTDVELPTPTPTPTPEKAEKKAPAGADLFPGVRPEIVADFKKLRTAKRAPVTKTAVEGITREAAQAGLTLDAALAICCERGWAGFKAEWLTRDGGNVRAFPQKPDAQPRDLPRLEA